MLEQIKFLFDLVLHLDKHLHGVIVEYGVWTHALLFVIIFMETGLVVTPFLPGDSLLFAAGAFAATGALHITWLWVLLVVAAILGDTANYWIGHQIGPRAGSGGIRFLNQEHLRRTHEFFEKHGGKTVILARFVPIVRTFAPFVAGVGAMEYGRFLLFNVVGGVAWVTIFLFAGFFFGNLPIVRDNFGLVIIGVIFISVIPVFYEFIRNRTETRRAAANVSD